MIEKNVSYKYKIYEKIKEDIITGVYSQGEVLNERQLSETLGVSRTPIREALQLLSFDGWVVKEPYKGTVVRTFDIDYVMNAQRLGGFWKPWPLKMQWKISRMGILKSFAGF